MSETILTARLLIRRFSPDDWRDLYEYLSQEETVKFEPYGAYTEAESVAEASRRAGDADFWAVCLKDGGKLISMISLFPHIFNLVHPPHQNQLSDRADRHG